LNYKLEKVEVGCITISLVVRPDMTNPNGTLHGGMYAMIFDEILGLTFYSLGHPHYYTTVNLIVDYLYAVPEGSTVTVTAQVLRHGKRIANVEGHMYDEDGVLVAHATTNLVNTQKEVFKMRK
jgi:uncharacterized domain 1